MRRSAPRRAALDYGDRTKDGRPPYDPVTMLEILVLGAMNKLSDDRIDCMILDRIGRLRLLDFQLGETIPDRNTIWLFREKLTKAGAFWKLFDDYEEQIRAKGYGPRKGQMADATAVSAPRQRMTDEEKARAKDGGSASQTWDKPEKARQKNVDACWTMKRLKVRKIDRDGKSGEGGGGYPFEMKHGYKNYVTVDKKLRDSVPQCGGSCPSTTECVVQANAHLGYEPGQITKARRNMIFHHLEGHYPYLCILNTGTGDCSCYQVSPISLTTL